MGSPSRLSATIGVATLYGRFATSFVGAGSKRGEVEPKGVAPVERHVRTRGDAREVRLEPAVELDRVDVGARSARTACEGPEAGPDLEHDIGGAELRKAGDDPEDVVVGEEVLPERLLRCGRSRRGGRTRRRVLVDLRSSERASSSPRTSARTASVWTTFAGSLRLPRSGCGAR